MKRVAVFLDAGYFWVQLCNVITGSYTSRTQVVVTYENLRALMLAELVKQFGPDVELLRVYWYDGPGHNGKTAEHNAIDRLDDFKLRLGTRNGVGNQKGVDGLIIADLISLTQQKAITHAMLMTGDADITPGVVAAQGMGLRVHLLSLGSQAATSPYLSAEVDLKRHWTGADVNTFACVAVPASAPFFAAPVPVAATAMVPPPIVTVASPVVTVAPLAPVAAPVAELASLAQNAYVQMQTNSLASQLAAFAAVKTGGVPPELDKYLLATAFKSLGRSLLGSEKRILRAELIKLL